MKKIYFASLLTCILALCLASCSDDRDSNPTVQQPESFVLNTPALAGNIYDLENSDSISFTYKQPEYGFTAAVNYYTQISLTDTWENSTDENSAPKFIELDGYSTKALTNASAEIIDKAIMKMGEYDSADKVPATTKLYVRMRAILSSGYECYSNTVTLTVKPYFKPLTQADPELWYMIGGCIGDGSWSTSNGINDIGKSIYPLCPIEGETYDETTGKGPLTFTGYFDKTQGFKIVTYPVTWGVGEQWGCKDDDFYTGYLKDADKEGENFTAPEAGYYTINLNTKTNTLAIKKATSEPTEYTKMYISGTFNNWGTNTEMTAVDTWANAKNHVWKYELSITENSKLKFTSGNNWWGGSNFPYGWGSLNGDNISVTAGDYIVIFNDITGYYYFYSK